MLKKFLQLVTFLSIFSGIMIPVFSQSSDKIEKYDSQIIVNKDGSLNITEVITFTVNGSGEIQHGIYRDYPTVQTKYGLRKNLDLEIMNIKKDGYQEPYEIKNIKNGKRIQIGDPDILIEIGTHTYEIKFRIEDQVRSFENYNELYHNVVGNDWNFPIENIEARIFLPEEIDINDLNIAAYTGYTGQKGKDFRYSPGYIGIDGLGSGITFQSTRNFSEGEGMTVSILFPKGIIENSGNIELIKDNILLIFAISLIPILGIYYLIAWILNGNDKPLGTIIPEFDPPKDLDVDELRYLDTMKFDEKGLVALLVGLGVKGVIQIEEQKNFLLGSSYTVRMIVDDLNMVTLSENEKQIIWDMSLNSKDDEFVFSNMNKNIKHLISKYKSRIQKKMKGKYIISNRKFVWIGILIHIIMISLTIVNDLKNGFSIDMIIGDIYLSFFLVIVILVLYEIVYKEITKKINFWILIFFIRFSLLMTVGFFLVFSIVVLESYQFLLVGTFPFIFHITWAHALKVRTPLGASIKDRIDGFKMYINRTEKHETAIVHKEFPKTLETYEKYLPYVIAFDMEKKWSRIFEDTLKNATLSSQHNNWYSGSKSFTSSNFASSFSSSMSSTMMTNSGSSGSGGSGGGSGGGGGGGW